MRHRLACILRNLAVKLDDEPESVAVVAVALPCECLQNMINAVREPA